MTCKVLCSLAVFFAVVLSKVEELDLKEVAGVNSHSIPTLVLFLDKLDGPGEKALNELTMAERKVRESMPGANFRVVLVAKQLNNDEALAHKVMRYPLLRAYQSSDSYQNYDG